MAKDFKSKDLFEDMFAEDNEKWTLQVGGPSKDLSGESNYEAYPSGSRPDSSNSASGDGFIMHGDSNSQQRSLENRSSSSGGINPEETSPLRTSCERVLPSIYDDDARSGSPGNVQFENKNLAFASFKKSLVSESSPTEKKIDAESVDDIKDCKSPSPARRERSEPRNDRYKRSHSRERRHASPGRRLSKDRRSHSGERKYRRLSTSRSHSRERRVHDDRRHGRDHYSGRSSYQNRGRRHSREFRRSRSRSYDRHRRHYRSSSRERYHRRRYSPGPRDRSKGASNSRKLGAMIGTSGAPMTPQMALQQTMAAMSAKAEAMTGIALPKYYNPAAVNPLKYAEQVQKRKLLWKTAEKEEEPSKNSVWDKMTFAQDQDGKMTAKFRKLMGIKCDAPNEEPEVNEKESVLKKQEVLFRDLDQQYETARVTTHTQRGVGLGYSQQPLFPVMPK